MRSAQRGRDGLAAFSATITDAASGAGIASGVPFTFVRNGAGVYDVSFDTRLTPVGVLATALDSGGNGNYANGATLGPGKARVMSRAPATGNGTNGSVQFQ